MVISSYASNYGYHKRCTCVYHEFKNQSTLLLLYQDIDQNWNVFNMFMYL